MLHAMCLHTPPQPVQKSFQLFQFLCRKAGSRSRLCLPENLCHCRCRLLPLLCQRHEQGAAVSLVLLPDDQAGRSIRSRMLPTVAGSISQ